MWVNKRWKHNTETLSQPLQGCQKAQWNMIRQEGKKAIYLRLYKKMWLYEKNYTKRKTASLKLIINCLSQRKSSVHLWPWTSRVHGCQTPSSSSHWPQEKGLCEGTHVHYKQIVPLNATYLMPHQGRFPKYTCIPIRVVILLTVKPT